MTERGLPKVDGPVACPFVAFEDDRDERASAPDHRHRCYAESPPAPRALAHQEAYCLAAAFPVCPIFQDWARREAAHARQEAPPAARTSPRGSGGPGMLPVDAAGLAIGAAGAAGLGADVDDADEEPIYEDPRPRRNPRQGWASPPPWMNRGDARGTDPAGFDDDEDHDLEAAAEGGLAGSVADRLAASTRGAAGDADSTSGGPPKGAPAGRPGDSWDDDLQPTQEPDDWDPHGDAASVAEVSARESAPPPRFRERERMRGDTSEQAARPAAGSRQSGERKREQLVAPSWERPARLEAYPTLRSRRLPDFAIPPLLVALVAVLLAALVLFLLPGFLGLGGQQAGASPTPGIQSSALPLGSQAATTVPEATQQTYVVQPGDTMSKIAIRFHVPLQTLIDANKTTIPDPNRLKIGDTVIIPVTTPGTLPGASPAAT